MSRRMQVLSSSSSFKKEGVSRRGRRLQLEEGLINGKERIMKYFRSGPIWNSGLCLVCVKGENSGQKILISGTSNVGWLLFGVSEIDLRGIPIFPNPDDDLHIGTRYKYGYSRRIRPGENGRPEAIYCQAQPCLYNAEYDYTILILAVVDLFGPLTKETLAYVKNRGGILDDFCALIEASNDNGMRQPWTELYEYNGWKRHDADNKRKKQKIIQTPQTHCTVSSYNLLTAHIQKAKVQAVLMQARLLDIRLLQKNQNISIMDVLPSSAACTDFYTFDYNEDVYIAQLLLSLSRT